MLLHCYCQNTNLTLLMLYDFVIISFMVAFTLNKKEHRRLVVLNQVEVGMLADVYSLLEDFLGKYILSGCF